MRIGQTDILTIWIAFVLIAPFIKKFDIGSLAIYFDKIEELSFVLLTPRIIRGFRLLSRKRIWGLVSIVSFCLYLFMGCLCWFFSPISFKAFLFQFLLELKMPFTLLAMIGVDDPDFVWERIQKLIKVLLAFSIPLILWQFLFQDSYNAVFSAGAHQGRLSGSTFTLKRAVGVFWHPGELAVLSGTIFGVFLIKWRTNGIRSYMVWSAISLVILICSLSRNEIGASLFGVAILYYFFKKERFLGGKLIVSLILICISYFLIWPSFISYWSYATQELGLNDIARQQRLESFFIQIAFILQINISHWESVLVVLGDMQQMFLIHPTIII